MLSIKQRLSIEKIKNKNILALLIGLWVYTGISLGDIYIEDDIQTYSSLSSTIVYMSGNSELHLTSGTTPLSGCQIHLNSTGAFLFLEKIKPSVVNTSAYLNQIRVNGAAASVNSNVRLVEYVSGTVVIPHSASFTPLQIYSGFNFTGSSMSLGLYTYYKDVASLGALNNHIRSFILKRGYMATFASNPDGTGDSRVYVAQDSDFYIVAVPKELYDSISFVRAVPWRWTSKKGWCGGGSDADKVDSKWSYDWDNVATSSLNREYVPMRHNSGWNAYSNINNKQNSTHALGFNEPDKSDQANMTVEQVIEAWPNLVASGLRLGSPATSDGGLSWLYSFIDQADARNYRVDFVAVHKYHDGQSIASITNWLAAIHERTGRPLWITEWNDGCNWTGGDPTDPYAHAARIDEMISAMDSMPFVERYAIYNWCSNRELISGGVLTPAGEVYLAHQSPAGYAQVPGKGGFGCAYYTFDGHAMDSLFFANNGSVQGGAGYAAGHNGQAIELDGINDYVMLPENLTDGDDFTFAAWVYWNGGGQWQRIFDFGHRNTRYMMLTPRSGNNTLRFDITTTGNTSPQRMETTQLASGQWVHVAVTLSGKTGKLFVNGSQAASNTNMTINPSDLRASANYLGRSHYAQDPFFKGRLDEVHIINYALTNAQIAALYNGTAGLYAPMFIQDSLSKPSTVEGSAYSETLFYDAGDADADDLLTFSKISGPSWLHVSADGTLSGTPGSGDVGQNVFIVRVTDSFGAYDEATLTIQVEGKGLRARYEFEGSAYDSTGFYHGTTTGSPAYLSGQFGQAINLDGVDDFVTLPAKVASNLNAVTVSAWINWDGGSAWQRIFDFGNGTSQYLFLTPSNGSVMRFAVKNGGSEQTLSASPPAVGQWVHVAVALNGSVGTLYVNGSPKATHSSMTIRPSDFNPSQNYIGKSQFSADPLFDGRIDDFRIYNYALSSSEIAAVYTASLLPPPPYFDGTAVSASRIDLSWDAVPGAAGYKIARSTASGGPYESVDDSAIGTTCSDTDLLGNLTYYYVIASVNEIGPGAYSPEIAVTTLPGQPTPWQGIVRPIPGQIEAEYYDDGGQNVSYYDTTPGNSGGQFSRIYGGVDLFACSDVGGGYAVGDIQSGEWLLYTVTSSASEVSLYARLASLQSGNQIRVLLDDVPLAVVEVPNTGSLSAWATVSVEGVSLPDSSHALLKLEFTGSDFRVNWVAFQSQSPYLGYPSALPGRIQFEDFDSGGQNISYYDTTAGNTYEEYRSDEDVDIMSVPGGYGVYMSPGEWMEYTCTSEPGLYTMSIRHASNQKTQTLRLSDESAVLAEVELPKTGGYSNWQDTLVSDVFLSGGQGHILRFTMAASTALLDYVDFIRQENPADFDGSGFVDLEDFSILSSQWLREPAEPSADAAPQGGDNWVDLQDLIALAENWLSH